MYPNAYAQQRPSQLQQPPQQTRANKTNKQLILVLDGSAGGESAKSILIGSDNNGPLCRFVEASENKSLDFCMVIFRGYPSGSELSVECSQLTTDFKYFIHWLDLVKFEGGGRRNHALTEGLYYASQFCNPQIENYVIVFTGSEYSTLSCISVLGHNYTAQIILNDMVKNKNARISLFCTRKIETLRQLWFNTIGEQRLRVIEENQQLWLLWGFEMNEMSEIKIKTFRWTPPNAGANPNIAPQQFQATLQVQQLPPGVPNGIVDPKAWPSTFEISKTFGKATALTDDIKQRMAIIQINKARPDDLIFDTFANYLSAGQCFAHVDFMSEKSLIIYSPQRSTLVGLYYNKGAARPQQPQQNQYHKTNLK